MPSFSRKIWPNRAISYRGLIFARRLDGAVVICLGNSKGETIISANEWASLIASLTPAGEDGTTFSIALALHIGGCEYDPDAADFLTEL